VSPKVYINRNLAKFGKAEYVELCRALELGLSVYEVGDDVSELADDGVCYIGFFPDQAPFLNGKALPLSGQDLRALTSLILNFCLGYIPTEVAAFKGEEDEVVSKTRLGMPIIDDFDDDR
jgi:hypothetical protein